MCGRYGGPRELEVLAGYLDVEAPFKRLMDEDNMLVGKQVDLLARNSQGYHVLKKMRWGLVPPQYAAAPELFDGKTFHARIETVAEKEWFRESWRRKWRCIFPMENFTQKMKAGSDLFGKSVKSAKLKITRADELPLGVAGIYNATKTDNGLLLSAAMLTRDPGPRMAKIHDREPVVIEPKDFKAWLDGSDDLDLLSPWADDAFDYKLVA